MMTLRTLTALSFLVALTPGCKEETRPQLYFKDLIPPIGVGNVQIVSDVSLNPATGGEVTVLIAVEPEIDREELQNMMRSFHRQIKDRRGFQVAGEPVKMELRFYTSEAKAKSGGVDWIAQLKTSGQGSEPVIENKQKLPLLKWTKKALGNMPEFTGAAKPQILADPDTMSVELKIPYVSDDGSGKYVENLTYVKAITEFVSYTRTLFDKIAELKKLTFIGVHQDQVVMKVWLTREQYTALDLRQVEESLGAFQGQFIELIISKQITEKAVEKKVIEQRRKVYRETLSRLPEAQVELDKQLR